MKTAHIEKTFRRYRNNLANMTLHLIKLLLGKYTLPFPFLIFFNLTNKCLNNCPGCFLNSTEKYQEISYEDIVAIERNIVILWFIKPTILLFGAEVTQHSRLTDIIKLFSQKKYKLSLRTNGKVTPKRFEEIINAGFIYRISISVYMDNIPQVKQLCDLINKYNLKHSRKIKFYLVIRFDLAAIVPTPLLEIINYFDDCGARHIRLLHPLSDYEYYKRINISFIKHQISLLKTAKLKTPLVFAPNIKYKDLERYYKGDPSFISNKLCFYPWFYTTVDHLGKIKCFPTKACLGLQQKTMGNLKTEKLSTIWNGKEYKQIRNTLLKPINKIDHCGRCIFKPYYGIFSLYY